MHPRVFLIRNYPLCIHKFLRPSLLSQTTDLCECPVLRSETQKLFLSRDVPAKWNSDDTLYRWRWKAAAKSLRTNSVSLGMVYLHCIWIKACRIPSVKVAFCQAEMRTLQLQNIQLKCHDAAVVTCCWKVLVWIYMKIIIILVTLHFSKVFFSFFRSPRVQESLSYCMRFWLLMLQLIVLDFDHVCKWRSSTLCP